MERALMEISGGNKLEAFLKEASAKATKASTMKVGFLENATYPDGTSVAMVAAIQNFGAPSRGIPPRPFFSNMVSANGDKWPDQLAELINHYKGDTAKALLALGEGIKGQLGDSIDQTNSPPLAPSTIRARGGKGDERFDPSDQSTFIAKPLIDTGHMKNSIDVEVK